MSIFNFDHSTDSGTTFAANMQSLTAFLFAFIFNLAQDVSVDDVYKWFFRILSLISLAFVVYINWNKARDYWRKNNKHGKA